MPRQRSKGVDNVAGVEGSIKKERECRQRSKGVDTVAGEDGQTKGNGQSKKSEKNQMFEGVICN